ncbi:MAG: CopG family transcriptional regulator [Thermoplasmata archaeon]|nr:MAG: CopG family transcriptional regulator [Thermoplasmata archaeon]RLF45590.1 MAG: CopG family transcriptional regulator [Thermoplasmata archaeon]HHH83910.1 CopG family transcriptional regulator [Thermoplasmatales archaeon]
MEDNENKKEDKKYTTVSIPTPLVEKIKNRIEGTGFTSVSSYVTYVLREVIANMDEDDDDEVFSKEDEEKVKERLRALGYLD